MKKTIKQEKKPEIAVVLIFVAIILLKYFVILLCQKTNSLLCILLDMNTNTFFFFVMFWMSILLWSVTYSIKTFFSDLRKALRDQTFRSMLLGGMVILLISQLFWNTSRFEAIKVNGKRPLRIQYNWYLLCDTISGETESLKLDANAFKLDKHSYSNGNRYGRLQHHTAVYACFGEYNVYLYKNVLQSYITYCQTNQKQIKIEYYKNSGIIKTIDGIPLNDEQAFLHSVDTMIQEEKRKEEAEKAIEEEAEAKSLALFSAFFESEGKKYKDIVDQLEKDGIENTYKTVFISTNYYETGEVAMFDNTRKTVYVVHDNKKEDMIIVPPIPHNSTLTDVTKILDDAGISWEYDCIGGYTKKNRDHSNDILKTYSCSPGTPVPKDYIYWFSVDHVE